MTGIYVSEYRFRQQDGAWGPWIPTITCRWEYPTETSPHNPYQQWRGVRYVRAEDAQQRINDLERALAEARAREGT
jgi:hypothetical protein